MSRHRIAPGVEAQWSGSLLNTASQHRFHALQVREPLTHVGQLAVADIARLRG